MSIVPLVKLIVPPFLAIIFITWAFPWVISTQTQILHPVVTYMLHGDDTSYWLYLEPVLGRANFCSLDDWLGLGTIECQDYTQLITTVVVVFWSTLLSLFVYWEATRRARYYISVVIQRSRDKTVARVDQLRNAFGDTGIPAIQEVKGHTHAASAAARNAASVHAELVATSMGLVPYFIQRSRSDERRKASGSRIYYWSKDLTTVPADFNPPDNALLVLIDTDYYLDINQLLSTVELPLYVYTIVPESVCESQGDFRFTFDSNNNIRYDVTGGASYKHQLWNHSGDSALTTTLDVAWPSYGEALCAFFWPHATAYNVEVRRITKHRSSVLYAPMGHWSGPLVYLLRYLSGRKVSRLNVVEGKYLRLDVTNNNGFYRSTGYVDEYAHATVPVEIDSQVRILGLTSSVSLTPASVQRYVDDHAAATMLANYHRQSIGSIPDTVVTAAVHRVQFRPQSYDEFAKPSLVPFMTPFVNGAYAFDQCLANDKRAVKGRIRDVASSISDVSSFVRTVMLEFKDLICLGANLVPTDHDEVYTRQTRPTQRHILAVAEMAGKPLRMIKSFIKKEAYGKLTDPRVISTICPEDKMEYSRYMYAFSAHMKKFPWYAFGHTPKVIAERVAGICESATKYVNLTDMSRMDGRVSPIVREFEKIIITSSFKPEYATQLIELMRSQHNLRGYTTFGERYETGSARNSGSPETSVANTLLNAFIAFYALRMTKDNNGVFFNSAEAWSRLGLYGGDDGLTADVDPDKYAKAASTMGQVLTKDIVKRGDAGVEFLARRFGPDVFTGDTNSCCDILRQLSKFHTTVHLQGVTAVDKLVAKCEAIALTDPWTPIFGPLSRKVLELKGGTGSPDLQRCVSWWAIYPRADQFPNVPAAWMETYVHDLDLDIDRFKVWLDSCNTLTDILTTAPLLLNPKIPTKAPAPLVLDGNVLIPEDKRCPVHPAGAHTAGGCRSKNSKLKIFSPQQFILGGRRSRRLRDELLRVFSDRYAIPLVDGIDEDTARDWIDKHGPFYEPYGLHAIFPETKDSPDLIKAADGIAAMRRSEHLDKLFLDGLVKVQRAKSVSPGKRRKSTPQKTKKGKERVVFERYKGSPTKRPLRHKNGNSKQEGSSPTAVKGKS
jgi:hypothetical protein